METRENILGSYFEKLIKSTFGVDFVKVRKIIPAETSWNSFSGDEEYLSQNSNYHYSVYSYSNLVALFRNLDVVHTTDYYSVQEMAGRQPHSSTKYAKYSNLGKALAVESPNAILIIVVCDTYGYYGDKKFATVYEVPDLTNYMNK